MTCAICDDTGVETFAEYGIPCSCICTYDQPGSPYFEGGAAFEAYQNQQERDLFMYGNSFTVVGERVHPSEVKIDTDGNCFIGIDLASKPDVTVCWCGDWQKILAPPNFDRMSRREVENEIGITQIKFTTEPVVDADGGYEIPNDLIESFRKWIDAKIIELHGPPPPPPTPLPDFSLSSLLNRNLN